MKSPCLFYDKGSFFLGNKLDLEPDNRIRVQCDKSAMSY